MNLTTSLDYPTVFSGYPKTLHALCQFKADKVADRKREPIAFAIVVDRSSSMNGEPLLNAKKACEMILEKLGPDDMLAIVGFSNQAEVLYPLQQVKDLDSVRFKIQKIYVGLGTNLVDGWMMGREELKRAPEGFRRRMLLLTDGQISSGICDRIVIRGHVTEGQIQDQIRTSTIGFGPGYDEELLNDIAKVSGGNFHDADSASKLPPIFREEFKGLSTIVAQDLHLRVVPQKSCRSIDSLSDYPAILSEQQIDYSIGDLCSDEERAIVFMVDVDGIRADSALLEIEANWKDVLPDGGMKPRETRQTITLKVSSDPLTINLNTAPLRWISVQMAGRALKIAFNHAQLGRIEDAKNTLKAAVRVLRAYSHPSTQDGLAVLEEFLIRGEAEQGFSPQTIKNAKYTAAFLGRPSTSKAFTSALVNLPSFTQRLPKV